MKKLGLLVMPMLVIPFLMSCSGKKTRPSIKKCEISDAVSLFSKSEPSLLKLNGKNEETIDTGLVKRTSDQLLPVPFLDENGNAVTCKIEYKGYVNEKYVYAHCHDGYETRNLFINLATNEVTDIGHYESLFLTRYYDSGQSGFIKNYYTDKDGNLYFTRNYTSFNESGQMNVEQGVGRYDTQFNLVKKYSLDYDAGYRLSDYYIKNECLAVNSNGEVIIQAYKVETSGEQEKTINKQIAHFNKDGNLELFNLPYELPTPDYISRGDRVFLGLDDKFYYFQDNYYLHPKTKEEDPIHVRDAKLYQLDFTNKNDIYGTPIWEPTVESTPKYIFNFEQKQIVVLQCSGKMTYLTIDYGNNNPSITSVDGPTVWYQFSNNNLMYGCSEDSHSLVSVDANNLSESPKNVFTIKDGIGVAGLSRDKHTMSAQVHDTSGKEYSLVFDFANPTSEPSILEVTNKDIFGDFIPA